MSVPLLGEPREYDVNSSIHQTGPRATIPDNLLLSDKLLVLQPHLGSEAGCSPFDMELFGPGLMAPPPM